MLLLQADVTQYINELVKQGPLITALIVAIKYFYSRQATLEANAKEQADKLEKYISDDRATLLTALENNTRVMQDIETIITQLKMEKLN